LSLRPSLATTIRSRGAKLNVAPSSTRALGSQASPVSGRTLPEPMQDEAYRDDKTCPGDDKKHSDDPQNVSSSDRSLSDDDDRISHDGQAGGWKA